MNRPIAAALFMLAALPVVAGQNEAEDAVTGVLFDENMENVSYSVRKDGFVDILFGPAVPETDYARIVERLRQHRDIKGVLAGRGKSDYCPIR